MNGLADTERPHTNGTAPSAHLVPGTNGESANGHVNGYANGHTNGHTNGDGLNGTNSTNGPHIVPAGHLNGTSERSGSVPAPCQDGVPVAICGMAMRLPGGIRDDEALFDFLVNKGDARSVTPADRYNVKAYFDKHGKPGTVITEHGYFLNDVDLGNFDHSMFTLAGAEAELMDPNQRISLEVVREALENSGEDWRGKPIGTYVGLFTEDWSELHHKDSDFYHPYLMMGTLDFALANRISYEYDLKGPSVMYKTACSSAGMGLHEALEAIRHGNISSAVVVGSNLILAPGLTISMSLLGALSPEGSCKSFDAAADGYARGEAVTALYIKRLDEAVRDGNPIRAVIRASAANADGRSKGGMANPNPDAHEVVTRQAYASAGLDMSHTAMVEAHGTGTPVGDPIEVQAIARCFGKDGAYLGSVKPNLGHSEGAAALTSVMKAVLSLEHRTIVPNIKFHTPNPAIPFEEAKLVVPTTPCTWPQHRAERISVSSYGIGGSNAHFIIDSAASFGLGVSKAIPRTIQDDHNQPTTLLFSAASPEALKAMIPSYSQYLARRPDRLQEVAYTLSQRREHLKYRAFVVTDGSEPLPEVTPVVSENTARSAFVFTGQGAQWVHMGRQLMAKVPSFLQDIRQMDDILRDLNEDAPAWSIEDVLLTLDDKAALAQAELSQPLCTAVQIGLVNLLATWGVTPSAVTGHSSGEIAAAYTAGALSVKSAIIAAYYRGFVCKSLTRPGAMAAIGMGKTEVSPFLVPGVGIACENSNVSVTLSGDAAAVEQTMSAIKDGNDGVFARKLQVTMAYHSDHMKMVGDRYRKLTSQSLLPTNPKIPFYSSVFGGKVLSQAEDFRARYWQDNLESPVLFHTAVKSLLQNHSNVAHVEIGPHSALLGPLRQVYQELGVTIQHVATLVRGEDDLKALLATAGRLYTIGVPVNVHGMDSDALQVLSDLPPYPWHYDGSYWAESRVMKNWRFRKYARHDLLGSRVLESTDLTPTWKNEISVANVSWLRDHCVGTDIVFPAAGYISMAGAAVCQLGRDDNQQYTVKDVELRKALVLPEDRSKELVTTLRPQRLTVSLDSDFYEFDIVSYDGSAWEKHCSGLVRQGRASNPPQKWNSTPESLPRKVSSPRWYQTLSRVGLNYGPRFVGLKNITSGVTERTAVLDITDYAGDDYESSYPLHPTTLDIMLQSWTVAAFKGVYSDFKSSFLPTYIKELYVSPAAGKTIRVKTMTVANQAAAGRENAEGQSYGLVDGEVVFMLKGFRGTPLPSDDNGQDLQALRLEWKPDFSFLDAAKLTRPIYDFRAQLASVEKLYVLCALEVYHDLRDATYLAQDHFEKYRRWMGSQIERFQQPDYPLLDTVELVKLTSDKRRKQIPQVLEECKAVGVSAMAESVWRTYDQIVNVFNGETDFLDLLIHDGTLAGIYDWMNNIWDFSDFFQLLGHTQPQMRILEIGAGTGGLTAKILKELKSRYGERLYFQYTFTDVSSGFFVAAQERFKEYDGIEYKVLDVSKDPGEQGFDLGAYDLIIASNVLHATPVLHETLSNVRKLLADEGRLFLQELSPITSSMTFVMGVFVGWWLGEADGRVDAPYLPVEAWDRELRAAGFGGCESVTYDNERPYNVNANIIARPAIQFDYSKSITLLSGPSGVHPLAEQVDEALQKLGYHVDHYMWGGEDLPPADQDLISFVDLETPVLHKPDQQKWTAFIRSIDTLQENAVLWLTGSAQVGARDPHAALVLGMARTIRSELAMALAVLESNEWDHPEAASAVVNVIRKVQKSKEDLNSNLDPDLEYAFLDGVVHVGRFHWYSIPEAIHDGGPQDADTKALNIHKRGLLETLHWSGRPLPPLPADEVQVAVKAVGLNFTDILIAMGMVHGTDALGSGFDTFGLEGAGIVSAVGSDISHVKIGDRVMILGTASTGLATQVHRPGRFTLKIPDELTFADAATMPSVYVTVLLGLVDKAQLEKGQSVLIHAAAGGIGIAAIQVARWIGAEIYCTVGSEEKTRFLINEMGVPRERIFHSRNTSFYDDLMLATDGAGVDCVLNSVSGELLHATWECVAANGCMVEIGKRDMIGRAQLALDKFEDNRSFFGIDVSRHVALKRATGGRLMELMLDLYRQGHLKPIYPVTVFEATAVVDAFRYFQQGTHIGKIVVTLPEDESAISWTPTAPVASFRGDRAYLLVGGMGGLGKAIATWMTAHGAKHIIFLSRSAGTGPEDAEFIHELELMGCKVTAVAGDVSDEATVNRIVATTDVPIGGVMQMAMILRDMGILDMDLETYDAVIRPRVQGTWNLHEALADQPLEFFVLFASIAGMIGYWGQANYAASNTFMDAFVQHRHGKGLPASVIDIGAVGDVGYISRTPSAKDAMLGMAGRLITESDFLAALHLSIVQSRSGPVVNKPFTGTKGVTYHNPSQITQSLECRLPIMDPENNIIWKRDPRMAIYRNIETIATEGSAAAGGMKPFLASMAEDPSKLNQPEAAEFLAVQIGERVGKFLMRRDDEDALDLGLTLSAVGVDSLVAIELRNWWKQNIGTDVSVLELMDGGSIRHLGELAAKRLKDRLQK